MDKKSKPSCTPQEIRSILTASTGGTIVYPTDPYNLVYPGIYIGGMETALDKSTLVKLGVTHVLNSAHGPEKQLNLIDTSEEFYADVNIKFKGVFALDLTSFNLSKYFHDCANFIEDALSNQGRVYVHCKMGISRSAALVLAFLVLKRDLELRDAVREVRHCREIFPNDGFLLQLCALQDSIKR